MIPGNACISATAQGVRSVCALGLHLALPTAGLNVEPCGDKAKIMQCSELRYQASDETNGSSAQSMLKATCSESRVHVA